MSADENRDLLARAAAGDLAPSDAARLLAACRADPALLDRFAQLTVVDRLLAHEHLYPDDEAFLREVRERLDAAPADAAPRARLRRFFPAWSWAAAAGLALVFAAWWTLRPTPPPARIVRMESATWEPGRPTVHVGEAVAGRRLALAAGLVEIGFARGATMIVEGPAEIEVRGAEHAVVHRGRVVTRLPRGTRGFILDSPRGRLIDQGTEFGVSVGPSGDTEVHVLEGRVEAVANRERPSLQLTENQAARLTPGHAEQFEADAIGFITDLPPVGSPRIGYLHWSFDEGSGEASHNRGDGLGLPGARALRRTYQGAGPRPQWIAGQFGGGLSFSGRGDFVECEFPGIAGGRPRTVAFWVKVPRDSGINEGYGIINWGVQEPGLAWQISVNPAEHEGPLGRLRLGVNQGWVVGTTDLRDDRWHHCAVVMYGGHRPDSATHILLYLDGELEPAARKAVREIRTEIAGDKAHNMWLGRNLGYYGPEQNAGLGRFFRGSVDEVFVFDAALDRDQIRSLMKYNRLQPASGPLARLGGL